MIFRVSMKMRSVVVQLMLLASVTLGDDCQTNVVSPTQVDGFGYELLVARIDGLENVLRESRMETMKLVETILRKQGEFESGLKTDTKRQEEETKRQEEFRRELQELKGITSCRQKVSSKSGWYRLNTLSTAFNVYCEQNLYECGWIVIQSRFDGSVDFYRHWNDYRNGFGSLDGEYWIGLEKIYQLTSSKIYELVVHMESFDGVVKYARYAEFEIGSEQDQYKLKFLVYNNGTAGDSLLAHKDASFSTQDLNNVKYSTANLAVSFHAGWWFNGNDQANLNGMYSTAVRNSSMHWFGFNSTRQGLKISKMMIREWTPGSYTRQKTATRKPWYKTWP